MKIHRDRLTCCFAAIAVHTAFAQLDNRWTVTVNGRTVPVNPDGSFRVRNISAPDVFGADGPGTPRDGVADDPMQVIANTVIDGVPFYAYGQPFFLRRGEVITLPQGGLTVTDVPPPLPIRLTFLAPTTVLQPGQQVQASILADLPGGTQADLTSRVNWTTYRTSNPQIVTVNGDGLLTAHGTGAAVVTAMNSGVTTARRITVAADTQPGSVAGLVLLADGSPVAGATVSTLNYGGAAVTRADGSFVIPLVLPTDPEPLIVQAQATVGPETFLGVLTNIPVTTGEIADAGIIELTESLFLWTNPAGGSWHTASNWNRNAVPGPNDHVKIALDGTYVVTVSTIGVACRSLTLGASSSASRPTLRIIGGGALTATEPILVAAGCVVDLDSGTLATGSSIANQGVIQASGNGLLRSSVGPYQNRAGETLRALAGGTLRVPDGLINEGLVEVGSVSGGSASALSSQVATDTPYATIVNRGMIHFFGGAGSAHKFEARFDNQGTINVDRSLTIETGRGSIFGYQNQYGIYENHGTMNVRAGTFTIYEAGNINASDAFFNYGTLNLTGAQMLDAVGGAFVNAAGGVLQANSALLQASNTRVTLSEGIVGSANTLRLNSCITSSDAPMRTSQNRAELNGGSFGGDGLLTNDFDGGLTLTDCMVGAPFTNAAALAVADGVTFTASGGVANTAGGTIRVAPYANLVMKYGCVNDGLIELGSPTAIGRATLSTSNGTRFAQLLNRGAINVLPGSGPAADNYRQLAADLDNEGTLNIGQATEIRTNITSAGIPVTYTNTGTFNVSGGDLLFEQGGESDQGLDTLVNQGTISIAAGRKLTVSSGSFVQPIGGVLHSDPTSTLRLSSASASVATAVNTSQLRLEVVFESTWGGTGLVTNDVDDGLTIRSGTLNSPFVNTALLSIQERVTFGDPSGVANTAGGTIRVAPYANLVMKYGCVNDGLIELGSPTAIGRATLSTSDGTRFAQLLNRGAINVLPGSGPAADNYRQLAADLDNEGTLNIGQATEIRTNITSAGIPVTYTNTGTINVSGGDLRFEQGGDFDQGLDAFVNQGTISIAPGHTVTVSSGSVQLAASSILTCGASASGVMGRLVTVSTTSTTLGGTLRVAPTLGYVPMIGDVLSPVCYSARGSSVFANLELDSSPGLRLNSTYGATCLQLLIGAP